MHTKHCDTAAIQAQHSFCDYEIIAEPSLSVRMKTFLWFFWLFVPVLHGADDKPWTWKDRSGKVRTRTELEVVLKKHQKWLETVGMDLPPPPWNPPVESLVGADLSGADLNMTNLARIRLKGAILRRANLYRADCRKADFSGADLTGASLSSGSFAEADFGNATLTAAYLDDANLREANFRDSN